MIPALFGRVFLSRASFFVYGTLVSPIIGKSAEPVGSVVRGAAKSVIKTGFAMGNALQKAAVSAKDGLEDIAAEAKSELAQKSGAAGAASGTIDGEGAPAEKPA